MRLSPLGLAIVGCGVIGRMRGTIARDYPGIGWIGLSDMNEKVGNKLKDDIKADFFTTDYRELLKRPNLTVSDARALEEQTDTIQLVDIELGAGGPPTTRRVFYRDQQTRPIVVLGTSENFAQGTRIPILMGRFFNGTELQYRKNVVVLGNAPYGLLFGATGTDPIGKLIRVGSERFEVVGVFDERPAAGGFNLGQDDFVTIPYTTYQRVFGLNAVRLTRNAQPRVERVRRAVAHDLDRVRAVAVSDIAALLIRIDDVVRAVDDLPLLAQPERRGPLSAESAARARAAAAAAAAAASAGASTQPTWRARIGEGWQVLTERVWSEARGLVRVTPVDHPEAMLLAPEHAYFLRENLKLRLLNARLALLSRQFNTAQSDLRDVQGQLERYFDRSSKRVTNATELVRQVGSQARGVVVPRPDETLAALAAVLAGR